MELHHSRINPSIWSTHYIPCYDGFQREVVPLWVSQPIFVGAVFYTKCVIIRLYYYYKTVLCAVYAGLILDFGQANERRCYSVTASLIGWTQT